MTGNGDFDSFREVLAAYDARDLLSALGALQLVPENLGRTLTLEFVAGLAAARSDSDIAGRSPSLSDLRRILRHRGAGAISHLEDPPENLVTESFVFTGGPYVLLPGIAEWPAFVLREICRGLFLRTDTRPLPTFAIEARHLVRGVMGFSTQIAGRAGLGLGISPDVSGEVIMPPRSRFDDLRQAVTYSTEDFDAFLGEVGIPQEVMEPIIATASELSPVSDYRRNPLFSRPLVRCDGYVLAPVPGSLASAAIHRVRCLAVSSGEADALAERYHEAVLHALSESLDRFHWRRLQPWVGSDFSPTVSHSVYQFDDDKLAVVLVVSDDLSNHDSEEVFGTWDSSPLHGSIDQLIRSLETDVLSAPRVNDALILLAPAGMGRESFLGLAGPDWAHFVPGAAPQLEMLSYLEAGDPQALLKFARADERLRRTTRVLSFSLLDEWNLYRGHNNGFYLTDESPPTFLNVTPGGSGEITLEIHRMLGLRGIPSWTDGHIVEVRRLYESTDAPVWVPIARDVTQVRVAVSIEGCAPIWILGPQFETEEDEAALALLYVRFADLFGYWLWQLKDSWVGPLATVDVHHFEIRLRLVPREDWLKRGLDGQTPVDGTNAADAVHVELTNEAAGLDVRLDFDITEPLMSSDNVGERDLMRVILVSLSGLADAPLTELDITEILDEHAPIGQKKKLMIVNSAVVPLIDRGRLRDYRGVQDADIESVLDLVGEHLAASLTAGRRVAKSDQNGVVKEAVARLYAELQRVVESLSPEHVLESLILAHESLIYEQAYRRLTVPTEIACFPDQPTFQEKLQEELSGHTAYGIASRFLIEYVTARPPAGIRPKSQTVIDYCLALCSQIAQLGFVSDAIEFELADMEIAVLDSGRLGMNHEMTKLLFSSYAPIFTRNAIRRATADFSEHWEMRGITDAPQFETIDEATKAEWGIAFQDLANLILEAIGISAGRDPVVMPRTELLDALRTELGWSVERVETTLDYLTLGPREDFLNPPEPFKANDAYPWRFGRPLSYVRRPFLRRDHDGSSEVLWGRRHLYEAGRHLVAIVTDGRIPQPKSNEMRRYVGSVVQADGEAFNDRVADALLDEPRLTVRRRVKKIPSQDGTLKPPGDIDVLVARRDRRELWLLECKSLALSRTPAELHNELQRVFIGSEQHPSQLARHLRRVEWAKGHIKALLAWIVPDAGSPKKWKIKHAIVADPIPVSSIVVQSGEPVLAPDELHDRLTN